MCVDGGSDRVNNVQMIMTVHDTRYALFPITLGGVEFDLMVYLLRTSCSNQTITVNPGVN